MLGLRYLLGFGYIGYLLLLKQLLASMMYMVRVRVFVTFVAKGFVVWVVIFGSSHD